MFTQVRFFPHKLVICGHMLVICGHNLYFVSTISQYFSTHKLVNYALKGVLHPRSVFGLFLHFSQKLQHIGNK